MAATPRLSLPFLSVGQAQKEFTHNEALQTLDAIVAGAVEEAPRVAPPTEAANGACYIIDEGATGDWAGKSQSLAVWTSGGWRFIAPVEGLSMYERGSETLAAFRNGSWEFGILRGSLLVLEGQQVVGPRAAAIDSPAGGAVIDAEARAAIDAILNTLRQHGLIES